MPSNKSFLYFLQENLLSFKDMQRLKFPMKPHRLSQSFKSLPTERQVCDRCKIEFDRRQRTLCLYHPEKQQYKHTTGTLVYTCCNKSNGGCCVAQRHVPKKSPRYSYDGFRATKTTASRPPSILAMDCEMVYTDVGLEVAKVSLVDTRGRVAYNKYVFPNHPIVDYNTRYSGITPAHMEGAVSFDVMQEELLDIIHKDTILIGHGLENDLRGLRLFHSKIVDTSECFSFCEQKVSLKHLVYTYLGRSIQDNEHDSVEDAQACLDLMYLKYHEYKSANRISRFNIFKYY